MLNYYTSMCQVYLASCTFGDLQKQNSMCKFKVFLIIWIIFKLWVAWFERTTVGLINGSIGLPIEKMIFMKIFNWNNWYRIWKISCPMVLCLEMEDMWKKWKRWKTSQKPPEVVDKSKWICMNTMHKLPS